MRVLLACLLVLAAVPAWAQEELTITKIDTPAATDLTISPTSDLVLNPTGKEVLPGLGYDVNLGRLTRKYLSLHAAELWVETLVAQNTIATIGGRILVAPTTLLTADLASGGTTIQVKHNNLANGDRVYMEADGSVEFMAITSAAGGSAGAYTYSVTRNLDGTGANNWTAGDAVLNTGTTGNGFIDLYSVRGVKAGTEIGPTIVGNVRLSATYNDWSPRWAVGNLDGLYGYSGSTYGAAFGVPSGARVTIDGTNGIRIFGGDNDEKVTIDTAGNATFDGRLTVGTGRNQIRNSDCRVGTEDWSVSTDSAVSPTLGFALSPWRLRDESNTCYVANIGTPANATNTFAFSSQYIPVIAAAKYEASAYIGVHRSGTSRIFIQWYDNVNAFISNSTGSNACTTASSGGVALGSYCRSGLIATAPTGAVSARIAFVTTHDGSTDPYLFWVQSYFGEAGAAQTALTQWGPAGLTEITGGMIRTDAIDARTIVADAITTSELAADSVTSAKIVAGTIVASDIATGTITADRMNVTTLSAISADLGTVTAGLIDGVTIRAGSGDEVILDTSGITLTAGTSAQNKIKWSDGSAIFVDSATLQMQSTGQVILAAGLDQLLWDNNTLEVPGGPGQLGSNITPWDYIYVTDARVMSLGGSGTNRFVCHDNDGDLYSSGTTCDGSAPAPAALAAMRAEMDDLRAEIATLRSALIQAATPATEHLPSGARQ